MKKVLFVCLGNICRSPAAEGIFNKMIKDDGLSDKVKCDSAGTINSHQGEPADKRMIDHAKERGYQVSGKARQFDRYVDFDEFDYIIGMDKNNCATLKAMDAKKQYQSKLMEMAEFSTNPEIDQIPDPYYGDEDGFDHTLNLLEDACQRLVVRIKSDLKK